MSEEWTSKAEEGNLEEPPQLAPYQPFLAAAFLLFFAVFALGALGFPTRARILPLVTSGVGVVTCTILLISMVRAVRRMEPVKLPATEPSARTIGSTALAVISFLAAYLVLVVITGYVVGTFLLCFLLPFAPAARRGRLRSVKGRDIAVSGAFGGLLVLVTWLVFRLGLGARLPRGLLEWL